MKSNDGKGKKNVLFLISRFLDGGIDTVLVEVLRMMAEDEQYAITLAIAVNMGELEVYKERLPSNICVEYLVNLPLLCRPKMRRFKKQSGALEKFADEAFMTPIRRFIQQRHLKRLIDRNDYVIDFDACHTAFLKNCRKPTFAWIHFSIQKLLEQNKKRTLRIVKRLRQYDKVVLICKAMQEEMNSLFPELQGKTTVIYNALDAEAIQQKAAEAQFTELDFSKNIPYILAVERLAESQKDITTLLKAYSLLNIPEHLVIIGKGKDEQRLKGYAESIGLRVSNSIEETAQVHFVGFQPNPYSWMKHAKMLVHSAKFEGFGLAIAEALLLGLPIVSTDSPVGPREILDNGKAGLLTPIGDAQALSEAIKSLLQDPELRNNLLAHAKQHRRNFTKEKVKPQLDELFK